MSPAFSALYRLQFREGMDFARAATLVPYLQRLGISHLYASPIFTAAEGSTHGYDVIDPGEVDPVLGGRDGLRALRAALDAAGMGLVLDIVPNHMAFSMTTPWLRDVLRRGTASRYYGHFDLDMVQDRLRLPMLEGPFDTMVDEHAFAVEDDPDGPVLVAGGVRVPLNPESPSLDVARETGAADAFRELHTEQAWRLTAWRTERDAISHRRFFNVTSLIGMRVEEPGVFDDMHALLFELVDDGTLDGIRIDHIDGLADPAAYLERLHARVGDCPIWVEKILTGDEDLPPEWPVLGTTGYVAAKAMAQILTDPEGVPVVDAAYREATGRLEPFAAVLARAKRQIVTEDLAAELGALQALLAPIAAADPVGVEFGPETLRVAIVEFIAAFPRYRTYMTATEVRHEDSDLIAAVAEAAVAAMPDPGAVPLLAEVLTRDDPAAGALRLRFQQVTGAAIAKSQEDTAFYRYARLLSANEVGAEPDEPTLTPDAFHAAMAHRAATMPRALTLASSHDTKRSEDARMRIAAITWAPEGFFRFAAACADIAAAMAPPPDDEETPRIDPELAWYLAGTLLAMDPAGTDTEERLIAHLEKALREGKEVTFWTAPNDAYEDAARAFARALAERFTPLPDMLAEVCGQADRLSMIETALKLTLPGIPDLYQGCEIASYRLTDPDNRHAVPFDLLAQALDDEAVLERPLDRAKFALTRALLALRREAPDLFTAGSYEAVAAPEGTVAFARRHGDRTLTVAFAPNDEARAEAGAGRSVWPPDADATGALAITFG